jgi:hypothetical protein
MSNTSSSDEGAGESGIVSELAFVQIVKDFPAVFSKSQTLMQGKKRPRA